MHQSTPSVPVAQYRSHLTQHHIRGLLLAVAGQSDRLGASDSDGMLPNSEIKRNGRGT